MTTDTIDAPGAVPDVRIAYAGKRILLTGATGFVAKVVLEKLVRTIPDLGRIVLLVRAWRRRPRRGKRHRPKRRR